MQKYERITKKCPKCHQDFITKKGHKKEKTYCSHKCCALSRDIPSRTKYQQATGIPKVVTHSSYYRPLCFETFEQKCQICGFDECVEVHHIDGNHKNAVKENLIPLCANHHVLVHKQKTHEKIQNQINEIMTKYFPDTYAKIVPQKSFKGYKGIIDKVQKDNGEYKLKISFQKLRNTESKIPSKNELEKLIWEKPSTEIAKIYQVSDSSIVKWCKKYGVQKPPRGYWAKKNATYKEYIYKPNKICPTCNKNMMWKGSKICRQCWLDK